MAVMALFATNSLLAQNNERGNFDPSEMAERQASRMAKTLDLKGDAKTAFTNLYKEYQTEKMNARMGSDNNPAEGRREKVDYDKLSDDEASALVAKHFDNEQKSLDIDRAYMAKFAELLTPQQLAKMYLQRGGGRGNGNNRGMGGGPGGMGGGDF